MKLIILLTALLISQAMLAQNKVIQLYDGLPPGSEAWTWKESQNNVNSVTVMTVFNVSEPSLTVYLPEANPNGSAVIIAPGGGFHFLAIDHEGSNMARILIKKGFTVFILKYRTFHITGNNPFDDMINAPDPKAWDAEADPVIPLAVADGRQAIRYVRKHAKEYGLKENQIGFMGFSAGGRVAASMAYGYDKQSRPDFVAPIYADIPESLQGTILPDAPPVFLACGSNDEYGFEVHAVKMYERWIKEKKNAELHLFANAGHGFGVGDLKSKTNTWPQLFLNWVEDLK